MKTFENLYYLLSQAEIFGKWDSFAKLIPRNAPIITSWHFLKNKVVFVDIAC